MWLLGLRSVSAVILFNTADPSTNKTAPDGALAGSGWQYEGAWGSLLGTPIAPHFFISAAHIGQAGANFLFQGSAYTIVRSFSLPGSDLLIWQVNETFPSFAPLYSRLDEVSQHLVVIGRGTQRGSEITLNGTTRGWAWGGVDAVQRWGENDVAKIVPDNGHDLLYATFDQHLVAGDHPNESHLSVNDSGGAIFLFDSSAGIWKLAGINYAVDDLYTAPLKETQFNAAIYDARGFYTLDGATFTQITGDAPAPTGFYGSRISSELPWICSVIADPHVGLEGDFVTLTYGKLLVPPSDLVYSVEQSSDLVSWLPATTQDEALATTGDIQTIKAKVALAGAKQMFLRLKITRPQSTPAVPLSNANHMRPRRL
jgi:hypothetical protein